MEERFRGKGLWFGLGCLALLFLCLLLMAGAASVFLAPFRMAPAYVQPAEPPAAYHGPGLLGGLFFGVKMLFKVAFLGLGLLLLFGVARRLFWGPYHWWPHYCAPVPSGKGWEGQPGGGAQPHTHWRRHWHHHGGPPPWWGPAPERPAGEGEAPGTPEAEAGTGYSGPQQ